MFGAFTAGLDAGYAFASWPLMGDSLFPAGAPMLTPGWINAVDNPIVVQFIHRWWAFAAAAALCWLAVAATRAGSKAGFWVVGLVTLQIMLGVATLMTGVLIEVAVAHQANAALLLIAAVAAAHAVGNRVHGIIIPASKPAVCLTCGRLSIIRPPFAPPSGVARVSFWKVKAP